MDLKRKPTAPGEILNEEYMKPMSLTQKQLAERLHCDIKVINRIINERTSVTAEMALKLGAVFKTSPEFWLNAQRAMDLYEANKKLRTLPQPFDKGGTIKPRKKNIPAGSGTNPR